LGRSYIPGLWTYNHGTGAIVHLKPGEYDEQQDMTKEDYDIIIPHRDILPLISFLDEHGYIKPKMDNQSRGEDVKIINRLLDLCEKKIK
jgi:hypothetical protein